MVPIQDPSRKWIEFLDENIVIPAHRQLRAGLFYVDFEQQSRRSSTPRALAMMLNQIRIVLFVSFTTLAGFATAEEYFPPGVTGWWQLQTIDTYEQVCASDAGPCNPPAGTYRVIDFGTSPATRTRVTISEPTSPTQRVFAGRRDIQTAVAGAGATAGTVYADCDGLGQAVGGLCTAVLNDVVIPLAAEGIDEGLFYCAAEDGASVYLQATCVSN